MKMLLPATVLVALGLATAANAGVIYFPYGNGYMPPTAPPGSTLVTDFSTNAGLPDGTNYALVTGDASDNAAPAYNSTTQDPNQYLALYADGSVTLALPAGSDVVDVYLGSLDSYNTISFSNGTSYTGALLANLTGAVDNGDQWSGSSNGLFVFSFSQPVSSVTFASSSIAFEVAGVSVDPVPEPSTWAMMLLGFAGLGYAGFRKTCKARWIAA